MPPARCLLLAGLSLSCGVAAAQNPRLAPYPEGRFTARAKDSINAYFDAEGAYKAGDYDRAGRLLAAFWTKYPPGTEAWAQDDSATLLGETTGANFGDPPCYSALRMLTDCADWRTNNKARERNAAPVIWTVVLVGKSSGLEPRNKKELDARTGVAAEHTLDPRLTANDFRILRDSHWLFLEYAAAMTSGSLAVRAEFVTLPNVTVPVEASGKGLNFAGPPGAGIDAVLRHLPDATRRKTDWWLVVHPSHVPNKYPPFAKTEFVTGGMGVGPDGASPCFLVDDLWFLRKPPHLGTGDYTEHERRAYLPQWYQHEFFHHLFRTYPDFKLEAKDHQWFDRKAWPEDFLGRLEADYYHQALHKRLRTPGAEPRMAVALRYAAPPAEVLNRLAPGGVLGEYVRTPPENDYHRGAISAEKDEAGRDVLRWKNAAGVSWRLTPDLPNGALTTGPDNPYFEGGGPGRAFVLVLQRGEDGKHLPRVRGFRFNGEEYIRQRK